MKTKITSIALLVLAGLFTSTESAKAYINMPDDLTWDASVGIFPVITQPAAAYYSAQRAYESALSAYEAATSANDSATSAYNAATSAYNAATISREAATSAYNAARSANDSAVVDWYYNYNNPDIDIRDASFAALTATTATYNSAQTAYAIFEQYDATQAAYNATQAEYNAAQTAYNQSLANVNAATSADPFSSFHIAVYSSQKIFNLAKSAYDPATSANDSAVVDWYYNYNNPDIDIRDASFAALTATTATYNSVQPAYDQSVTTLRAAVSSANAVPEPSTYGLIGVAALGVAFAARRRKAKVA